MKKILLLLLCVTLFNPIGFGGVDFSIDSADYITLGTDVDITTDLTVSVWFRVQDLTNLGRSIIGNELQTQWGLWIVPDNHATSAYRSTIDCITGGGDTLTTTQIVVDTWYHLVCTREDGTDTTEIWINGVKETNQVDGGNGMGASTREFLLGLNHDTDGGVDHQYNGDISEAATWDVILTDSEIVQLYSHIKRMPLQIQPNNLKFYLPLDDLASGTSITGAVHKDLSGNSITGTGVDLDTDSLSIGEQVLSYP